AGAVVAGRDLIVPAAGADRVKPAGGTGASERLLATHPEHPKPAAFDRLDQAWYQRTIGRLQERMQSAGLNAVLLTDRWNIIYFTGLFHTTTERLFAVLIPSEGMNLTWFHPSLDRDLVGTWWIQDKEHYFDLRHSAGGFPDEGKVVEGDAVDLLRWTWEGLKKRGYGEKAVGVDAAYDERARATVADVAPKATVKRVDEVCLKLRMIKTAEEIALTQRAMNYWSRIHAFTRDLILARGTDLIDHEIAQEAIGYGVDLIMKDIKRDGRPHTAVGVSVEVGVRSGIGTAFPHPNQFHYNPVRRGDSLQVSGVVTVGGYGGELYRAYQLAPWDAHREQVWQAHTESCRIQLEQSIPGVACSHVAKSVHDYQVKAGMQKYIYHRPAHGQGMEGHQPPYIALGDFTTIQEGMMFSNEPGLYDPEGGFGYNHSDCILITPKGGLAMSSVPMTKEWCFLKI
ncbi:MAG TPA: M24 family metallopeptidase, partial [Patescibacteria group bacterium]|nr:M24 family metallopeptidase [Patescibacteria group bacterium]